MCDLRKDKKTYHIRLHVLLYKTFVGEIPDKMVIDHINRNKLDNRLENLRLVNYSKNLLNREFPYKPDISFIKTRKNKPYMLRFTMYGKRKTIGYYDTYDEAENKYKELYNIRKEEYIIK